MVPVSVGYWYHSHKKTFFVHQRRMPCLGRPIFVFSLGTANSHDICKIFLSLSKFFGSSFTVQIMSPTYLSQSCSFLFRLSVGEF